MKTNAIKNFFFIFISICIFLVGCKANDSVSSEKILISIYPTSSYNETYYIELDPNKNFTVMYGMRNNDLFPYEDYFNIDSADTIKTLKLPQKDYDNLINTIQKVRNDYSIKYVYKTKSWNIALCYNGRRIETNIFINNENLNNLKEMIIDLSPVEIDLHSW